MRLLINSDLFCTVLVGYFKITSLGADIRLLKL